MILVTTNELHGHRVTAVHGMVRGNSIRARHLGKDILANMRMLAGGEVTEYTKMIAEAREQAVDRMIEDADGLGANAILSVRFQTTEVHSGAAEMLCYGTAVTVESIQG